MYHKSQANQVPPYLGNQNLDMLKVNGSILNQYTGWCDVNLKERGVGEERSAGRLLAENGVEIDHVFTSVLKRASFTTNMCLNMANQQ